MLAENNRSQGYPLITRLLIACGAIGPILFILVFMIDGSTRPGYSEWRNFVSSLSLSNQGWIQIINFVQCGVLVICFAIGLRQVLRTGKGAVGGPLFIGIFGLSLIMAGVFVTDPSLGYPPGSSSNMQTLLGTIHGANAPIAFGSLVIAICILARRFPGDPAWRGWAIYSVITGILVLVFFIACLTVALLDEKGILPNSPTGLFERIAIYLGWGWLALLALKLLLQMRLATSSRDFIGEADSANHTSPAQEVK